MSDTETAPPSSPGTSVRDRLLGTLSAERVDAALAAGIVLVGKGDDQVQATGPDHPAPWPTPIVLGPSS